MKRIIAIAVLAAPFALLGQVAAPDKDKEVRTEATLKWITVTNWTQTFDAPHVGHTHAEYPEVGTITKRLVAEITVDGKKEVLTVREEKSADIKRAATFTVTKTVGTNQVTAVEAPKP